MQTDIGALQALPQAEHEGVAWPCTVSDFEDPDDDGD